MSITDRRKISGTVTERTLTTETGRIATEITRVNDTSDTTGITPLATTSGGRIKAYMKTSPDRVTGTKNVSTKNGTLERRQVPNQTKAKHLEIGNGWQRRRHRWTPRGDL